MERGGIEITPVDLGVVKDLVLDGLGKVMSGVRFVTRMPREFAGHGDHFVHPLDTESDIRDLCGGGELPLPQPHTEPGRIPDIAGRDLL